MLEPHVVPQLVREDRAAAGVDGQSERPADVGDAAQIGPVGVDNQVHEVGPDALAEGVNLVQVAVAGVVEASEIELVPVAGLGVRHLGPVPQRDAMAHPARLVGLVRLGDHQVDHGLDGGGPARRPARGRV